MNDPTGAFGELAGCNCGWLDPEASDEEWMAGSRPEGMYSPEFAEFMELTHAFYNYAQLRRDGPTVYNKACNCNVNAFDIINTDPTYQNAGYRNRAYAAIFVYYQNQANQRDENQAAKEGSGDPSRSSEFNLTFTFGPQVGINIGDYLLLDIKIWMFGEIGTKSDLKDSEFHDGKITSEHSLTAGLGSLTWGRGIEHRIGHQGYFYDTDKKDLYTSWGTETKIDRDSGVVEKSSKTTIFELGLFFFSFEITKDYKK